MKKIHLTILILLYSIGGYTQSPPPILYTPKPSIDLPRLEALPNQIIRRGSLKFNFDIDNQVIDSISSLQMAKDYIDLYYSKHIIKAVKVTPIEEFKSSSKYKQAGVYLFNIETDKSILSTLCIVLNNCYLFSCERNIIIPLEKSLNYKKIFRIERRVLLKKHKFLSSYCKKTKSVLIKTDANLWNQLLYINIENVLFFGPRW